MSRKNYFWKAFCGSCYNKDARKGTVIQYRDVLVEPINTGAKRAETRWSTESRLEKIDTKKEQCKQDPR